jgi:DNA replication protein DnaC
MNRSGGFESLGDVLASTAPGRLQTLQETGEEEGYIEQESAEAKLRRLAVYSGIPLETRRVLRFSTWDRKLFPEAILWAEKLAELSRGGDAEFCFLTLAGPTGVGKTHLVIAVAWEWLENGRKVKFFEVCDLLDELRATLRRTERAARFEEPMTSLSFHELLEQVKDCDLLVLDDLGLEKETDWTAERLDNIINYRYLRNKPLLVTTNALGIELPPRIADRLRDARKGRVIQMSGASYRMKV